CRRLADDVTSVNGDSLNLRRVADFSPARNHIATRAGGVVQIAVAMEGRHGCRRARWVLGAAEPTGAQAYGAGRVDTCLSRLPSGDAGYRMMHWCRRL